MKSTARTWMPCIPAPSTTIAASAEAEIVGLAAAPELVQRGRPSIGHSGPSREHEKPREKEQRCRRDRRPAQPADPEGVDNLISRLEDVRRHDRHGKRQERTE